MLYWSEERPIWRQRRGFAAMDPARQREIASEGGRVAHEKGRAHEWTGEEAGEAGRKGGTGPRNGLVAETSEK